MTPRDPVLASDVQVKDADDCDRLRFSLTGEGGINDGAAFPFVILGLGLLGLYDLVTGGWHWLVIDVLWAIAGGLLIGGALGALIGTLVAYLRGRHRQSVGLEEFLALGLVALAYGVAALSQANGFLAVFAAGLALQRVKEKDVADGTAAVRHRHHADHGDGLHRASRQLPDASDGSLCEEKGQALLPLSGGNDRSVRARPGWCS